MKLLPLLSCLVATFLLISTPMAMASGGVQVGSTSGTGTTVQTNTGETTTNTNGTEACDWTEVKTSIAGTESGSQGCTIQATGDGGRWGRARGKYQFIEASWNTYARGCPGASNCPHTQLATAACCMVQECAMDNLLAANKASIERNRECQAIMGTTINSNRYGSCTVTMSGLLAAAHLAGAGGACRGIIGGGRGRCDRNGTCTSDYICRHGGRAVPGQCTPTFQLDPNQEPPPGTLQQLESRELFGDLIVPGDANGLLYNWVGGLMLMAEQFTANMIQQMQMLGELFDAKDQLETQRLLQQKMAEAHKDYQPSDQMCTYGTFARDLVATERAANLTRNALATELMQREIGAGDSKATEPAVSDSLSRIADYRAHFCSQTDNGNGLNLLCPTPAPPEMRNRDINYTQTIDMPLSLDINLTDANITNDERAVFALIDNLFANDPMPGPPPGGMNQAKFQYHYMNLRSLAAMRGVVRSTIANVIALKTASPVQQDSNASYLLALFREFGLEDNEIRLMLGDHPSYYAQMEILTKKIYQNPTFYTNLYDKPANVQRIRAAMTAIKLMQDRDIGAALQRREMLLSIMLELRLRQQAEQVYNATERALYNSPAR